MRQDFCNQNLGRQPPSGGCVLKPAFLRASNVPTAQPPSGGCVLKHTTFEELKQKPAAAAFGRLCVETVGVVIPNLLEWAAAFGRLCVETPVQSTKEDLDAGSRLRAAVC